MLWLLFSVVTLSGPSEVAEGELVIVKAQEAGEVSRWVLPEGMQALAGADGQLAFTAGEPGTVEVLFATIVDNDIQIAKHRLAVLSQVATAGGEIRVGTREGCDWCSKWKNEVMGPVLAAGWKIIFEHVPSGPVPQFMVKFPNNVELQHEGFMSIQKLRELRDQAYAPGK